MGDAGYSKDPCTAAGTSDAFRDAEYLSRAIDDGFSERCPIEEALAGYERRRNEEALPSYEFTCGLAPSNPPSPEMLRLFNALRGNQADVDRFFGVFAQTVSVPDFFAPSNVERILQIGTQLPFTQ